MTIQSRLKVGAAERRSQHAKVIQILFAGAEEFAEKNVGRIDQVNIEFAEFSERANALLPAGREEVRSKVREPKAVSRSQRIEQFVLVP
jgi:hypothetical protein